MAINRFDRPGVYDFNMEHFVPNFQLWDTAIGQLQLEKDTTEELAAALPKHIKPDEEEFLKYKEQNLGAIDEIADLYVNNSIAVARGKQRDLLTRLKRERLPGGKFSQFEKRVEEFTAVKEALDKQYEDAPGYMKQEAYRNLMDSITPGAISESINNPMMGDFVDILPEWMKLLDGWKSDSGTFTLVGNRLIIKDKNRQVTEQELRNALIQISKTPKFQEQLGLEAGIMARNIARNPGVIDEYNTALDTQLNDYKKELDNKTEGFSKEGYEMLKKQNQQMKATDAQDLANKLSFSQYADPVIDKYTFTEYSRDIRINPEHLVRMRAKSTKALIDSMMLSLAPKQSTFFNAPAIPVDMEKTKKEGVEAERVARDADAALAENMEGSGLLEHIQVQDGVTALRAYEDSNGDAKLFKEIMEKKGLGSSADAVYGILNDPIDGDARRNSLGAHLRHSSQANIALNNYRDIEESITSEFNRSDEGIMFWQDQFDKLSDKDVALFKNNYGIDISTPEALRAFTNSLGTDNEMFTNSAGETFALKGKVGRAIRGINNSFEKKRNDHFKNNPTMYQSISPVAFVGETGSAADQVNKHAHKVYTSSSGLAFSNIEDGGPLKYKRIDGGNGEFGVEDVKMENISFMGMPGESGYFITGTTISPNKDMNGHKVVAYAGFNTKGIEGNESMNGLRIYHDGLDTSGNNLPNEDAIDARKFGAKAYFDNAYPEFDFNLFYQEKPRETAAKTVNVYSDINGQAMDLKKTLQGVTEVGQVILKETQVPVKIYAKYVDGDNLNYFITRDINVEINGQMQTIPVAASNPNGTLKTYDSPEAVISPKNGIGVAEYAARDAMRNRAVWEYLTKSKTMLTNESMNQMIQATTILNQE